MQSLLQDVRFAARRIVKDRWFTVAAVVVLALGIGANSAVFTLVNAVLLRGLPLDNADRIMWIDSRDQRGRGVGVSFQDYEDWRAASRTFSGMTLVQNGTMILSGDEPLPESYPGGFISANAFEVTGVKAQLGRGFLPEDDREGAPPVALISGGIWKTRYASDPAMIGKAVRVNTIPATIGRLLQSLLFQTGSADPLTLVSITILLLVIAVTACLWPAWHATQLNPVTALRYE